MDSAGYITITGRLKDIIIRGGENIHPLDIENRLLSHDAVSDASACGVPDDVYGEVVAVFLVLRDGGRGAAGSFTAREAREWVRKGLGGHFGLFDFLFLPPFSLHLLPFLALLLFPSSARYISSSFHAKIPHSTSSLFVKRKDICHISKAPPPTTHSVREKEPATNPKNQGLTACTSYVNISSSRTVPKHVFFTTSFPKTPSGKVQRFKLREEAIALVKEGKGAL